MASPQQARPILGLRGVMGAGKDTLAERIHRVFPEYTAWKFGTILREAVTVLTGFVFTGNDAADKAHYLSAAPAMTGMQWVVRITSTIRHVVGDQPLPDDLSVEMRRILFPGTSMDETVALRMTVGRLLQVLGTECFRDLLGSDVWVDALFRRWFDQGSPPIVIADVRFPNEVAAVMRRWGVVIAVTRRSASRSDGRQTAHISEHALDDHPPDITISNDSTPADLDTALMAAWPRVLAISASRRG